MIQLTVLFDGSVWVAMIEGAEASEGTDGQLYRHMFGGEPTGPEVYLFVLYELRLLLSRPGVPVEVEMPVTRTINPKRKAREAARSTAEQGISSAAQEAMELQRVLSKQIQQANARAERRTAEAARYNKAQAKAKEKRRGH